MIITIQAAEQKYDIQADENSSIRNTLLILAEKSMLAMVREEIPGEIYSVRRKRKVLTDASYRENGIFQGDILRVI